jgi:hypothetical protein
VCIHPIDIRSKASSRTHQALFPLQLSILYCWPSFLPPYVHLYILLLNNIHSDAAIMANRERLPPPPPPDGFQAPLGMVQGGPVNRPQQTRQPRQYPPAYPQNYQQGGPAPAYRPDTYINNSSRIHDIRPEKSLSESFCLKELTSYEVFTILPSLDEDGKDSKGNKDSKDSKDSKDKKKDKDLWIGFGSGRDKVMGYFKY